MARRVNIKIINVMPTHFEFLKLVLQIYVNAISIENMYDSISTVIFFMFSVSQK